MGIEDILSMLGGQKGEAGGLASIMKLFGGNGGNSAGLQGMMSQLQSSGMQDQVQSWIGQGQNKPVSGEQIRQAVDPTVLNQVAEQAHISPEEASNKVAQVLPEMVNQVTPQGQMPSSDPFSQGLGALKSMFGAKSGA
ncbi:MAG TPA: YidB family protein [Streptosporangiaceae bacterium]|jgi:uncharacterized protein YidB (DUF937 family)